MRNTSILEPIYSNLIANEIHPAFHPFGIAAHTQSAPDRLVLVSSFRQNNAFSDLLIPHYSLTRLPSVMILKSDDAVFPQILTRPHLYHFQRHGSRVFQAVFFTDGNVGGLFSVKRNILSPQVTRAVPLTTIQRSARWWWS